LSGECERKSIFAVVKVSRAWMYEEGIELLGVSIEQTGKREVGGGSRVSGHVGTYAVYISGSHYRVDGERTPVGLATSKCERSNFALGNVLCEI